MIDNLHKKCQYTVIMIKRQLEKKILEWANQYPVITVTGPRQSGKTTLCRAAFPEKQYVSLEDLDQRSYAKTDPRGFLSEFPEGAILDEIQHVPELLSYIQTVVDGSTQTGIFVLTGSRQFEMMEPVTQSLAGRTAIAKLYPFSYGELYQKRVPVSVNEMLYTGFYPRIHDKHLNPTEALSFYIATYVERDVRQILSVTDLHRFEIFLQLCAGRTGQLLNMQSLGSDCGVTHNTIKSWLSVLQESGIIKLLQPWHANIGKRLIKTPKLYFIDTGLACCLLGIQKPEHLIGHPLRGALFETFVVSEAIKQYAHTGSSGRLWFYRDSNGVEVDLLVEDVKLSAWEVKSAQTISSDFFKGLRVLDNNVELNSKSIIYCGKDRTQRNGTKIIPWNKIGNVFVS